jgi:hypothetical protein
MGHTRYMKSDEGGTMRKILLGSVITLVLTAFS